MAVGQAAVLLQAAGVAALLYTTPSHDLLKPAWRVLCPLSKPHAPADRSALLARLNTVLGGVLSTESFALSQSFYYGSVKSNENHMCREVDGEFLDLIPGIAETYVTKQTPAAKPTVIQPGITASATATSALQAACKMFDGIMEPGRHKVMLDATRVIAPFVKAGLLDEQTVIADIAEAMSASGRDPNPDEVESALRGAVEKCQSYEPPTDGSEFPVSDTPPRKRYISLDCSDFNPDQKYVVKGLIAPGDVCALIGQPGAGKSTLAPHLAFCVAQGRRFFGKRTKAGRTLYAAAESLWGIKQRLGALGMDNGHTDDCAVVECGNLCDAAGQQALMQHVREFRPVLVIIDTFGAAFAGMDENDSRSMGEVVKFARAIASTDAAVMFVHHPPKNGDGSPRGHSVLNATLDMLIAIAADDVKKDDTVVRGSLQKNKNGGSGWSLAFTKKLITLGVDSDGDASTTTLVNELTHDEIQAAPETPSDQEARALNILGSMIRETDEHAVEEAAWQARCIDQRVSTASTEKLQRRSVRRTLKALLTKNLVNTGDGKIWPAVRPSQQPETVGDKPETIEKKNATEQETVDAARRFNADGVRGTGRRSSVSNGGGEFMGPAPNLVGRQPETVGRPL